MQVTDREQRGDARPARRLVAHRRVVRVPLQPPRAHVLAQLDHRVRWPGAAATMAAARCTRRWATPRRPTPSLVSPGTCSAPSRWPPGGRDSTVHPDRHLLARACAIAVLAVAGCGGSSEPAAAPTETSAPAETAPAETAAPSSGGGSPAINSVTVDPGDGTIMIGSGPALFRLAPGAKEAERLTGRLADGQASLGNLVVRFAGPGRPAGLRASAGGRPAREPRADPLAATTATRWEAVGGPGGRLPRARAGRRADPGRQRGVARHPAQPRRRSDVGDADAAGGADRRRRRSGRPGALGGLDRAGHVRLDQRRPVLAPARHHVRGAAGVAREGCALQRGSQRRRPGQHGRRPQLGRARQDRRAAERGHRRPARTSCSPASSEARSGARVTVAGPGRRSPL